jgi:hypothetical protein
MLASVHDLQNSQDYTMAPSTFQGVMLKYLPVQFATILSSLSAPSGGLRGLIALGTSVTLTDDLPREVSARSRPLRHPRSVDFRTR